MAALKLSTGLPGLDRVIQRLMPGDNVVWQVESLGDVDPFIAPFCQAALERGDKLIYFRFADHKPLVPESMNADIRRLCTADGFEKFIADIHRVIHEAGPGTVYVFDCLSTLVEAWCSDRMLGNFFMLICPTIYNHQSLAYFPLYRHCHSFHATTPIAKTAQILADVYRHEGRLFIHPTKVEHRYSATMYMLHQWDGELFRPVTDSSTTAEILTRQPWAGLESIRLRLGKWTRTFLHAEECWETIRMGRYPSDDPDRVLLELIHMAISRDERLTRLVTKYLTLTNVLDIWRRMIGTGLIGGKAVGMILARAILKQADPRWNDLFEPHDSFFIGSDVFCSFLVENGCWWLREKQRNPETFLEGAVEARRRILQGTFPEYLVKEFSEMLDYYGQSPIIVRSSSLLEDSYGNAFSGKYESVFCINQGPHRNRLEEFLDAVKTIYASSMSEKALRYRAQRGLLDQDEQMSLLVQRISGIGYGSLFYPQIAGVGLSRNPYVWSDCIDPEAGVVRLVFGLGTRAVGRSDDDYTRIVALNAPERRPEGDFHEVRQYSQRNVDVIDLEANQVVSREFAKVASRSFRLPVHLFASRNEEISESADQNGTLDFQNMVLTFDELLSQTPFVCDMREMLKVLQNAYEYPVDLEFTANFFEKDRYKINLVQCWPLQVATSGPTIELPKTISSEDCILEARGAVIGQSRVHPIDRLIYVVPEIYGQLSMRECYSVARMIGRLMHIKELHPPLKIMLVGPGRWGTTTPSLGVPVSFAEIDSAAVLCEIVTMREDLTPDVSLGTHFFSDLVEMDMLYLALYPGRERNSWNHDFFDRAPNRLAELLPDDAARSNVVRVIDAPVATDNDALLMLNANALTQQVVCYLERKAKQGD